MWEELYRGERKYFFIFLKCSICCSSYTTVKAKNLFEGCSFQTDNQRKIVVFVCLCVPVVLLLQCCFFCLLTCFSHFRLRNPKWTLSISDLQKLELLLELFLQVQRLPFLHSSNMAMDILRGNDECIGFEDILNGKYILALVLWKQLKVKFGSCEVLCLYWTREINSQNAKNKIKS